MDTKGFSMAGKRVRRHWSDEEKITIVEQTKVAGVSVAQVARRYAVNANLIHKWLKNPAFNRSLDRADEAIFLPIEVSPTDALSPVIEHEANKPPGICSGDLQIAITTPSGVRIDISDCGNVDLICQLVRGLQ